MKTRQIPNTNLRPSVLCLGTDIMGSDIDRSTSFTLLDTFFEAGGTFFDTAKIYADWRPGERSSSEKNLGAWIKERGVRDQIIVATKGAHPDLKAMHIPRLSPADITGDLNSSLTHLQFEPIDLYWLHRDDPQRPVAEILETLQSQVQAGKIRHYGCSNWRAGRLREAHSYAREHGLDGFVANQPLWNLARVEAGSIADPTIAPMDDDLWELHRSTGLACIPFSSQANGFFHKVESGQEDRVSTGQKRMYLTDENRARAGRLLRLKQQTGLTTTQVILGYLLGQPFATFPIVGPHSMEHLLDTLGAGDVTLTEDQISFLNGTD